ncbi:hypothetical protein [Glaciecola sp. 1036]|uniref:hypothetical protein n=1 Tax=Alteromonadaceae TaxID=72275 RepID=UPI003D0585B4
MTTISKANRALSKWQIFKWPSILFVLSFFGLILALLVDGAADWFAVAAIAVSVIVPVKFLIRRES